jgi:ribosome-binding protein aMBF1 (putative translation factor)
MNKIPIWDYPVSGSTCRAHRPGRRMSRSIHTAEHLALRELLVEARKSAGIAQHEVARRIGRPQSFVAKYEGGERRIDVIEFFAIARALGRDPKNLFAELAKKIG